MCEFWATPYPKSSISSWLLLLPRGMWEESLETRTSIFLLLLLQILISQKLHIPRSYLLAIPFNKHRELWIATWPYRHTEIRVQSLRENCIWFHIVVHSVLHPHSYHSDSSYRSQTVGQGKRRRNPSLLCYSYAHSDPRPPQSSVFSS